MSQTTPLTTLAELTLKLSHDFPAITIQAGTQFYWSPKDHTVFYDENKTTESASWALLHELSHGVLGHTSYKTDFELLKLEVAAWQKAKELAAQYDITIAEDHIQDCLDTYRDWLHARSECPACTEHGLQKNATTYSCLNCHTNWHVSSERFCRPYRMSK